MHVVSVNVGLPRTVRWKGRDVTTGIFKKPVEGRIALRRLNLDGDRQADLSVHGGAAKAIYAYPLEHYAFWREQLEEELPFGTFGENLMVESGRPRDAIERLVPFDALPEDGRSHFEKRLAENGTPRQASRNGRKWNDNSGQGR
jgi:MOSC domain-containing protein